MSVMHHVTLLDGLRPGPIADAIGAALHDAGVAGPVHHLAHERFAPCQGCWQCWIETPGECKTHDDANEVMADTIGSDAVLWTTAPVFGCWDPFTKAALDRSIGLLSPFFRREEGETHHRRRYHHYPRWGAIAVVDVETPLVEFELFRRLMARNALNFHGGASWVGFLPRDAEPATVRAVVRRGIEALAGGDVAEEPAAVHVERAPVGVPPRSDRPRHAVLWVGSAKPAGQSTSEALGQHLLGRLAARGWTGEVVHVARTVRLAREEAPGLVAALRRADLVVLATPVYVDVLPSLVLAGLARLLGVDWGERPPALLPIVQCGFPELEHTALAVEVAARAAERIGLGWAGHLAMGGGGIIDGAPLATLGGRVAHQVAALDDAAAAIDAGGPVPAAVTAAFGDTVVPASMYRLAGNLGWIGAAVQHGSLWRLWDRPFREAGEG